MTNTLASSAPDGRLLEATRCSMMNNALHRMARVMAICTAIKIAPTLLRRMAEMMGPNSMGYSSIARSLLRFELPRGLHLRGTPSGVQTGQRCCHRRQDHRDRDIGRTKMGETGHFFGKQ